MSNKSLHITNIGSGNEEMFLIHPDDIPVFIYDKIECQGVEKDGTVLFICMGHWQRKGDPVFFRKK
jgi:hypothetical protein